MAANKERRFWIEGPFAQPLENDQGQRNGDGIANAFGTRPTGEGEQQAADH